jgi:hypothetical protein
MKSEWSPETRKGIQESIDLRLMGPLWFPNIIPELTVSGISADEQAHPIPAGLVSFLRGLDSDDSLVS